MPTGLRNEPEEPSGQFNLPETWLTSSYRASSEQEQSRDTPGGGEEGGGDTASRLTMLI